MRIFRSNNMHNFKYVAKCSKSRISAFLLQKKNDRIDSSIEFDKVFELPWEITSFVLIAVLIIFAT